MNIVKALKASVVYAIVHNITHVAHAYRQIFTVDYRFSFTLYYYYYYYYYCYYYHFTAAWTVSLTTRVSRYQKGKTRKVKPIWIYWSKI